MIDDAPSGLGTYYPGTAVWRGEDKHIRYRIRGRAEVYVEVPLVLTSVRLAANGLWNFDRGEALMPEPKRLHQPPVLPPRRRSKVGG